ncbi:MAG: hypothetical protein H6599_05300 [Flavobacteriales bacterium]|nr:hypothetical protein [Flavobacteriales bacterium]
MKTILLSVFTILGFSSFAGVITCSNNPNSPGQYISLQDAVDNANANDTILVAGSPSHYGTVINSSKALTIIGAGINNPNGYNTEINYLHFTRASSSVSATGSKLIGVRIINVLYLNPEYLASGTNKSLEDIVIERCHVGNIDMQGGSVNPTIFTNILIKNCILSTVGLYGDVKNNIRILNNIITSGSIRQTKNADNSNVLVANNIFLWNDQFAFFTSPGSAAQSTFPGMVVNNNIFYYASPNTECHNCSFSNNITYNNLDDTLLGSGNPGSTGGANQIGVDPEFVNYPIAGASFDYVYDFHLQPGSPGIGAGSDGTDIGIYGGVAPFTDAADVGANPAIPQMLEITTPLGSTVSKGTNLNVTFKSYKQD